jgi:hypothetical protein
MKKVEKIGLIKGNELPPLGHQNHQTGSGYQKDKRTKRNRTRQQQKKNLKDEYPPK